MDASMLVAAAACLLTAFILKWVFSWRNLPPGPMGLPVFGYSFFLGKKPYFDFQVLAKKYGNIFSLRLGSAHVVVLNDFESTKEAFVQDELLGRPTDFIMAFNPETIKYEAMTGLPWKEQRRFSLHMLRDLGLGKSKMEAQLQEEISDLLEHLEENAGKPFYVYDLLAPSMSNNIGSLMFGKRFKYDDPVRMMMTMFVKEMGAAGGQAAWKLFFPWMKKICRFLNIMDVDKQIPLEKQMRDYIKKETAEHEETLNPNDLRDFIDGYILEIKKRNDPAFCKPVLQDLAVGFFLAGSETVRLTVEWLLLTVAVHQDAQRRIHHEIDEVIGQNQTPAWTHHTSMPYTEAFIMELNRWRTIIPINILRVALTDSKVKGFSIPKGSYIMSNHWAIHHDPQYWGPDAEDFKPERFLTQDGKEIRKWDHYIPFSIGKRACPGEPLAKVETFLYFTSILQKFDITLPDGEVADLEGVLGVGLQPKPQNLIFTKRS